ncbi:tRNA1(Val) (adenine(37)-N6)-methyltransferase [Phosphitispora sp. TUW77]|uniref:tRNA1(Val) (adenine(37)-N6)-methyltransferase n=1 Tax=Phosphitispora sp. TUW77 TaxID=3152361 RepID=UPI003AB312FF
MPYDDLNPNSHFNIIKGERLDDLIRAGLKIIQSPAAFCFSLDAVLLSNFTFLRPGDKIIDLGTGSGVIPLLLASRKTAGKIVGLEIQEDSCDRARRSVWGNRLEGLIDIIQGDICKAEELFGVGGFDVVVTNPPYLPVGRGAQNETDPIAIARHEILCSLEDVVSAGSRLLRYGGLMTMVHRPERLSNIIITLEKHRLKPRRLQMVHANSEKKPIMILIEAQLGGNSELNILEPFFVYNEDGSYTKSYWDIYYPGIPYSSRKSGSYDF